MQMRERMDAPIDAPMSAATRAVARVRTDAQELSRRLNSLARATRTQHRSARVGKLVQVTLDATPNARIRVAGVAKR
jgi:hypothetical protein